MINLRIVAKQKTLPYPFATSPQQKFKFWLSFLNEHSEN